MIVSFVAHGDFLLPNLLPELSVHVHPHSSLSLALFLENPAHVVEEPNHALGGSGTAEFVDVVKEPLGILVSLGSGTLEPLHGGLLIPLHLMPQKVEFAQLVLGVLVPLVSGGDQEPHGLVNLLWQILPSKEEPPQPVLGELIALFGRPV